MCARRAFYQVNYIPVPIPFLPGQWTRLLLNISNGGIHSPYPAGLGATQKLTTRKTANQVHHHARTVFSISTHATLGFPEGAQGWVQAWASLGAALEWHRWGDDLFCFVFLKGRGMESWLVSLQCVILLLQPKILRRFLGRKLLACTSWNKSNPSLTLAVCFVPSTHLFSRLSVWPLHHSSCAVLVLLASMRDDSAVSSDPCILLAHRNSTLCPFQWVEKVPKTSQE